MEVVYHVGFLPIDRLSDPELDARAREYLERGTPLGRPVYHSPPYARESVERGRGEGELSQRRLWPGVYEYRFRPFGRIGVLSAADPEQKPAA